MSQTIIICDDHPLVRGALRAAVTRVWPESMVRETSSLTETQRLLETLPATLLLLDLHMKDSSGFAGLIALRHDYPALPIIIVSGSEEPGIAGRAVNFGAAGYVPKSTDLPHICEALEVVYDGGIWMPEDEEEATLSEAEALLAKLTPSQLRVLIGVKQGRLNKQIAYDMGITEATVKAHMTAIFRKLGVQNRTQAVLIAGHLDIVSPTAETDESEESEMA